MKIDIPDETLARIVTRANTNGYGYNKAWLDGCRWIAIELGIVRYNKDAKRYEETER